MANLEAKSHMSPIQLAIVVFVTCVGAQILLLPTQLLSSTEQAAWVSTVIGGVLFYAAVCMMLKLGLKYPSETLLEYMPRLWGRMGGKIIIFWFTLLFIMQISGITCGFGKVITFYMFDRTPPEVVTLGILLLCVYCAVQDWGTIVRVQQILFFTAYTIVMGVWMLSIFSFQPENLLPLWPLDIKKVLTGSLSTWGMYSGYELVLFLLPLVYPQTRFMGLAKPMLGAFGCMTFLFATIMILIIGVLTAESAKEIPYPALVVIRSVELPGTFIERLENYLLLTWIPIVFDTLLMMLFIVAQICMRQWKYVDHRPFVLLWLPIVYLGNLLMESQKVYEAANKFTLWLGIGFSFIIIPISLLLARRRKRGGQCLESKKSTD